METLLHGYIIFAVLGSLIVGLASLPGSRLLAGLSIWVRPDGTDIAGTALCLSALLAENNMGRAWKRSGKS
jgi:hypothetical protein